MRVGVVCFERDLSHTGSVRTPGPPAGGTDRESPRNLNEVKPPEGSESLGVGLEAL